MSPHQLVGVLRLAGSHRPVQILVNGGRPRNLRGAAAAGAQCEETGSPFTDVRHAALRLDAHYCRNAAATDANKCQFGRQESGFARPTRQAAATDLCFLGAWPRGRRLPRLECL